MKIFLIKLSKFNKNHSYADLAMLSRRPNAHIVSFAYKVSFNKNLFEGWRIS